MKYRQQTWKLKGTIGSCEANHTRRCAELQELELRRHRVGSKEVLSLKIGAPSSIESKDKARATRWTAG